MKYREVLDVLGRNGFELIRQRGSHRRFRGTVGGQTRLVTIAFHSQNEEVLPATLASIIRQSGLPRSVFRG